MTGEFTHRPEIDPELLEDAQAVLDDAGVGHLAGVLINKGGETSTVLHGLAERIDMIEEAGMTSSQVGQYVEDLVQKFRADS